MPSVLQAFFPIGKVFAIRIRKKRPCETGGSTSHPSPPTTDSPQSRLLSEAGEVFQLVSPMVQAVAGAIPVVGTPLKATVDGSLYIIQIIDVGHLFRMTAYLSDRVTDHQAQQGRSKSPSLASSSTVRVLIAGTSAAG
jgi:hypothetical protein